MQYKTKPQVVEAIKFLPTATVVNNLIQFTKGCFSPIGSSKRYIGGHLKTDNGTLHVKVGDYIIRQPNGEFTKMGSKEFKNSYDPY